MPLCVSFLLSCLADTPLKSACYEVALAELRSGDYRAAIATLSSRMPWNTEHNCRAISRENSGFGASEGNSDGSVSERSARTLRARLLMLTGQFGAAAADWKVLGKEMQREGALGLAVQRRKAIEWHAHVKCADARGKA